MSVSVAGGAETFDYVVVGSGFGGSVSALRLTEKGYRVLVLERGKRYRDQDFAKTNWIVWKYLWLPAARCFGILEMNLFQGVLILHGSGVGGGSLGYAGVLLEPGDELFAAPAWRDLADWKSVLRPHYDMARRMLGVAPNPCTWRADSVLMEIRDQMLGGAPFQTTDVGVFFGEQGTSVPDPFFGGEGPQRTGCLHCGACMIGCRYGSKNTLVKNYLWFAEKYGAEVRAESEVRDIRPLPDGQPDGARYEIVYRSSTSWLFKPERRVRARSVVLSAGVLGTLGLLFRCRDVTASLPRISARLGDQVRTNSEALLGVTARNDAHDFSQGVSITSILRADDVTHVEPVRYPQGSSFMRLLGAPLIDSRAPFAVRLAKMLAMIARHPLDFLRTKVGPRWAQRSTIMLVMQTKDNMLRMRWGRSLFTLFRRGLLTQPDPEHPLYAHIETGHKVTEEFARRVDGIPQGTWNETLLNIPTTAHVLGGCPMGRDDSQGVVSAAGEVFNYPGLYVVDGSIVPANPGVNPSLTITALAEYVMSHIPARQ